MEIKAFDQFEVLKQQWLTVSGEWGASSDVRLKVFNQLVSAYSAANRHYHGISHIEHMLEMADDMQSVIEDHKGFYFAIWFHDAVQLEGQDSEGLSAELAVRELEDLGVPQSILTNVTDFILGTKHHNVEANGDIALFLDIDLSILSASRKQYQAYADGCRKEYCVPSFIYRYGRKKFLRELKKRAFIFNTQLFQSKSELAARENIEWELQVL